MELLPECTQPASVNRTPTKREVVHTIKDKNFGEFLIVKTANAWWEDVTKVKDLISAFKRGLNLEQSLVYIGISKRQYYYFLEVHPEFCNIKEVCEIVADAVIVNTAHEAAMKDGRLAMMWLDRRGFFNKPKVPDIPITTQQSSVLEKEEIKEIVSKVALEAELIFAREKAGLKIN